MSKADNLAKARAKKAAKAQARAKTVAERVQEILAHERVDRDLKDKLRYCQQQIQAGRDEGLVTRRRELISEAQRRYSD